MSEPAELTGADALTWDLSDLYRGMDDPALSMDLDWASAEADRLAEGARGRVAGLGPADLRRLLESYEALLERLYRPPLYASLCFSADTRAAAAQALLASTRERTTDIHTRVQFLVIELRAAPDGIFAAWLAAAELRPYRHFLQATRRFAKHTLGEPEERVAAIKGITGAAAWAQLFDETVSSLRVPVEVEGEVRSLTVDEARALRSHADRSVRQRAVRALHEVHVDKSHVLGFAFNTLFQDHKLELELRRYSSTMEPTLLEDELDAEVVETLMATTERNYGLVQRYYRAKARVLGLDDFASHDLLAPLPGRERRVAYEEARRLVLDSFASFSPVFAEIAERHFSRRWIDVMPRPGKRGGAFCAASLPALHPYVLCNYNARLEDVSTLAHELGHAVHFSLAGRQRLLNFGPTTPMAETASVFGEMILLGRLTGEAPDALTRRALLGMRIEDAIATVFRQVMYTRWEQQAHARRAEGVVPAEEYASLWQRQMAGLYGDAVALDPLDGWGWIGIPHFIHSRFYCYSYAFGQLLVLALYRRYEQEGERFVPRYLELLAGGGAGTPDELLAGVGIDLRDPVFWQAGFLAIDRLIEEFERS